MNENGNRELLALKNLSIGYPASKKQTKTVAKDLNASLKVGELVCLLGPNGAGKSTLMRTMAGMQKPLNGNVLLDGTNLHNIAARDLAKRLSVVLTERISIGSLSAYSLVALGRYPHTNWAGTLTAKDHEVIAESLKTVGASDLSNRMIGELSDGERQKVMVARALAQEPQVVILDEITAFLDLPRRVEIMRTLRGIARSGCVVLMSTHDLDLALKSADKIWLLPKDGSLKVGIPEDLVLSGAFEDVFSSEKVEFDKRTGSFKIHEQRLEDITVEGDGDETFWTIRALEREGFHVNKTANETKGLVIVSKTGEQTTWHLSFDGDTKIYDSLQSLLSILKENSNAFSKDQ